jgi:hypothetical protein
MVENFTLNYQPTKPKNGSEHYESDKKPENNIAIKNG